MDEENVAILVDNNLIRLKDDYTYVYKNGIYTLANNTYPSITLDPPCTPSVISYCIHTSQHVLGEVTNVKCTEIEISNKDPRRSHNIFSGDKRFQVEPRSVRFDYGEHKTSKKFFTWTIKGRCDGEENDRLWKYTFPIIAASTVIYNRHKQRTMLQKMRSKGGIPTRPEGFTRKRTSLVHPESRPAKKVAREKISNNISDENHLDSSEEKKSVTVESIFENKKDSTEHNSSESESLHPKFRMKNQADYQALQSNIDTLKTALKLQAEKSEEMLEEFNLSKELNRKLEKRMEDLEGLFDKFQEMVDKTILNNNEMKEAVKNNNDSLARLDTIVKTHDNILYFQNK
jgi:hypothetical protein